jgi:hypothetical protein
MIPDHARHEDAAAAQLGAGLHESPTLVGRWTAVHYAGDWTPEEIAAGLAPIALDEHGQPMVYEGENILVNVGIQLMLDKLIGAAGTVFDNTNAYIGIGDSNAAVSASQTDLQASTNKVRKAMDATFPSRSGQTMTWRCTFSTSEGNFSIQEAGIFNASSAGTMLNRLLAALGTKTSATTLQVTATLTIS